MKFLGFYLPLLLLSSCAIVKVPTGGPEDKTPPSVISEVPENPSTTFNSSEITIKFDEYIELKNPKTEIQIVPPLTLEPKISVKNKKISIELRDSLKKDITYSFFFGNSITDITEGNILKDYQYVLTTGNVLDSLEIRGQVKDAFTMQLVKNARVLLHPKGCDSCIFSAKPISFTSSDEKGNFTLKYLKSGEYILYALEDQNGDLNYDPGERVAFLSNHIKLMNDTSNLKLLMFKEKDSVIKINELKYIGKSKLLCVLNMRADHFKIYQLMDTNKVEITHYQANEGRDSFLFWIKDREHGDFILSLNDELSDTLTPFKSKILKDEDKFEIAINPVFFGNNKGIWLKVNQLLNYIDPQKIRIYEDSVLINNVLIESNPHKSLFYRIDRDFKKGTQTRIILEDSALYSFENKYNDSISYTFVVPSEEDLGKIQITVKADKTDFPVIIELINEKGIPLIENKLDQGSVFSYLFDDLWPGNYRFRIIIDRNGNGYWDSGNLNKGIQPEEVFYYNKEINLKPNWEITDLEFEIP